MITGGCPIEEKKTDRIGQRSTQMKVSSFIENFTTYKYIFMLTKFESFYATKLSTLILSVKL